jgi:hypothetical protein
MRSPSTAEVIMTKDKMKIMTAKPLNAETPIERLRTLAAADATMRQALTCVGRRHTPTSWSKKIFRSISAG